MFKVTVSTFRPWGPGPWSEGAKPMENIDETAQGSEMAFVWTLLIAASALVWLLPLILRHA